MVTLIQRSIDRPPNVTPRRLFGDGFKTAAFFEFVKSQGLGPGFVGQFLTFRDHVRGKSFVKIFNLTKLLNQDRRNTNNEQCFAVQVLDSSVYDQSC